MGTTTTPSSRMRATPGRPLSRQRHMGQLNLLGIPRHTVLQNRTKRIYRLGQLRIGGSIGAVPLPYINPLQLHFYIDLITAGQTPIIIFSNV